MSDDPANLVLMHVEGRVANIVINRPERHNSLTPALLDQFLTVVSSSNGRDDVDVVVLKAAGTSFSTGGDLSGFLQRRHDIGDYADHLLGKLNDAILSIVNSRHPFIAAVDGQVCGGSIGLVLAADIVVVTERASFTPYYVDVGFSPDGGWAALLPAIIGRGRALSVQLLNETISPQQAVAWGIASEQAASGDLEHRLTELCARLLEKKRGSLRATKKLLHIPDLRERLEDERKSFVRQVATREAIAGIESFLAKGQSGAG